MKNTINSGIYPTMITPYNQNGDIDYDAVKKLVDWYIQKGCTGIFAVCQSSEMMYLTLEERIKLAAAVVSYADGKINVVASGHCADDIKKQAEELDKISETGIDAFVLVSNRLDLNNDGDDVLIYNAEKLLDIAGNKDIPLGIYECPKPYKRLLTPKILEWCINTKRFKFIKDTCCDPDMLKERAEMLKGSGIKLFNANEQTFLHSLKCGGDGYSGIMANFHPELLVWLYNNYKHGKAEFLSSVLSMSAFTEGPTYPCSAKWYLGQEGIQMNIDARSADKNSINSYQKLVLKQMYNMHTELRAMYGLGD